jgi:hypothetical protein
VTMISKDFKKLFTKREIQEINGKNRKNLIILISILFGTFMAIAISKGGIEYLGLKMNDPFVQNLDIEVPYSKSKEVEYIKTDLNQDSLKTRFQYDTVLAVLDYPRTFRNNKKNEFRPARGQSMEPKSPILKQVLGGKNKIAGKNDFQDNTDCGIIVRKKFLDNFGYSPDALFVDMQMLRKTAGDYVVPVPIIAVVNDLPGLSDFGFTSYFFKMLTLGQENPFDIEGYRNVTIFAATGEKTEVLVIRKIIEKYLKSDPLLKERGPLVEFSLNTDTYRNSYLLDISFYPQFESSDSLDGIYNKIINLPELKESSKLLHRYYRYSFPQNPEVNIAYDKISVSFKVLTKVRLFEKFLLDKYALVVEMSKVKDKENFIAISILTVSMATMLLIFSIISVGLFIFNLLKTHLDRIKTNLGTFKAFGLSNRDLQSIYKGIVRRFYLRALIIAYGSATFMDILIVKLFFRELKVFHLFSFYTLGSIIVIWAIVEWVFSQTSKTILVNTPGDLIYGRDHI